MGFPPTALFQVSAQKAGRELEGISWKELCTTFQHLSRTPLFTVSHRKCSKVKEHSCSSTEQKMPQLHDRLQWGRKTTQNLPGQCLQTTLKIASWFQKGWQKRKKLFKQLRKLTTKSKWIIFLCTNMRVWKTNVQNTCTINSQGRKKNTEIWNVPKQVKKKNGTTWKSCNTWTNKKSQRKWQGIISVLR